MINSPLLSARHKCLIGILALLLALAGIRYLLGRAPPSTQPARGAWNQPTPVRVVSVDRGSLDVQIKSIGTVTPLNTVTVRSRVDGVLTRVLFIEGAEVELGTLLAEIDPLPYQARLAQAEGLQQQMLAIGTLWIKALFKNEDDVLFSNQFVNVRLRLYSPHPVSVHAHQSRQRYGRRVTALSHRPELADVASDLQQKAQELYFEVGRDVVARLAVSAAAIAHALHNAFGQRKISTLFTQANQYRVILELDPTLAV